MSALLWTLLVLGCIEFVSAVNWLMWGICPPRTRGGIAINAVFWAAFAAWAAYLLVKGGAA